MKDKTEGHKEDSAIHIAEAIATKSKMAKKDIEELDKIVKQGIAKYHSL